LVLNGLSLAIFDRIGEKKRKEKKRKEKKRRGEDVATY